MRLSADVLADGIANGLVYALLAMGIVLVYRSSQVINFAAAAMGLPAAGLVALLNISYGVPYGIALALGLAAGVVFAGAVELIVVRRLFTSPRVILLVATIGVAQLALGAFVALPDVEEVRQPFPSPITADRTVFGAQLSGPEQTIAIVAPLLAIGLGLLMTRSRFGRKVTASADNPSLARLSGVSPKQISTLVWMLAGLVSSLSLILIAADARNVSHIATLGPATLTRALVAAVIAGMASFPRTVLAGVVIGALEATIGFNYLEHRDVVELLLFAAVIVAVYLLSRRSAAGRAATFRFTPQVRPIPRNIRDRWWVQHHARIAGLVALGAAAVLPLIVTLPSRVFLYTTIILIGAVALSASVITGWSGQLSLGQMALAGFGALSAAALVNGTTFTVSPPGMATYEFAFGPMGLVPAAALAALIAGLIATLIGSGALRVSGLLLALTTFVFAYVCQRYFFRLDLFTAGASTGTTIDRGTFLGIDLQPQRTYYWFSLVAIALVVVVVARLQRRGPGRTIRAVRDNADAASAYGINPPRTKLTAFAISGVVAGFAGALLGGLIQRINTTSVFIVADSLEVVSVAVIGGLGSVAGPFLGAVFVRGLPAFFPDSGLAPLLTSSLGLLILLLYFPGGFVQIAYSARDAVFGHVSRTARAGKDDRDEPAPQASIVASRAEPAGTAAQAPLVAEHLKVTFGGNVAVDDVSFRLGQGEVVGLIGTNGAGKSTVLNAVGGFVRSEGTLHLLGRDVSASKPHERSRLGLGRTFQAATLFPELTVHETVMVALEARRRSSTLANIAALPSATRTERWMRSTADDYLGLLGLGRFADSSVSELSTGSRRIVELAGILALGASVLCLDEPTAGVAQRETEAFGPLLLTIREQLDASILVVEHDMPLIMSISDRLYCLESGAVIASGRPEDVRDDPAVINSYLGIDERAIERSEAHVDGAQ